MVLSARASPWTKPEAGAWYIRTALIMDGAVRTHRDANPCMPDNMLTKLKTMAKSALADVGDGVWPNIWPKLSA